MARIFQCGFEDGDISALNSEFGRGINFTGVRIVSNEDIPSLPTVYYGHTAPRYGDYVCALNDINGKMNFYPKQIIGTNPTDIYVSFKMQQLAISSISNVYFSITSPLAGAHLYLDDDGEYMGGTDLVYGGNTRVQIPTRMSPLQWHTFEIYLKLSTNQYTADGEYEFRLNGKTVSALTNIPTSDENDAESVIFGINFQGANASGNHTIFDDIIIDSTSCFDTGTGGVVRYKPSSDQTSEWTPSSGSSHYEIVEEKKYQRDMPYGEYLATDTTSDDSFTIVQDGTNTIDTTSTIYSVHSEFSVCKYGKSSVSYIKPYLDISGSKYYGSIHKAPLNNFYSQIDIWEQNPYTLTDWSAADIVNLIFGVESKP